MKEMYMDELTNEQENKKQFDTITRGNVRMGRGLRYDPGRSKPHDMDKTEYDEKNKYYETPQAPSSAGAMQRQPSEYEKKINSINDNLRKIEEIGKICYGRTRTIQDVLLFLNNVKDHYNFNKIT